MSYFYPLHPLAEVIGNGLVSDGDWIESKDQDANGDVRLIQLADIGDGRYLNKSNRFLTKETASRLKCTPLLAGDVLIARMPDPIGRACIFPGDAKESITVVDVCILRVDQRATDAAWLMNVINADFTRSAIEKAAGGTTRTRVSRGSLEKLLLPTPSLQEQHKIAAILTAVDDKLDVIARQIEATQTLKQGLMQTLFSRGAGTRGSDGTWSPPTQLHQIDGRELPRAWRAATLGAYVAELRSGVSVNAEDRVRRPGEVGVLKVSSVQSGRFLPSNHKTVVPMEVDRVAEPVQEGCIIISRANTPALVGESAYVVESCSELFLPDKLWQTRPTNEAHSTRWLAFYLQSSAVRQEIQKAATGTSGSMKNISKVSLLSIFMPLVPLEEQHHIANLLGAVTSKIEALEAKHRHHQTLKRGLMQKLLTGEWRVKLDAEMAA